MLYYEKIENPDSEDWVLFIHGLGGSMKTWKYQQEHFAKEYNLLLVDLDGHGNSNLEHAISHYKPTSTAKLINKILIREKIKRVHIVSLSLGTLIALEFVRMFPKKVSSIVLAGGIINLDHLRKMIFRVAKFTTDHFPVEQAYTLFAYIIMPFKQHKKSREIFIRESKKLNQAVFRKWVESVGMANERLSRYIDIIRHHKIPTLFISGINDYMFVDGIRDLCRKTRDFQLKLIKGCGHVCSIEKAEIFNAEALAFLRKVPVPKRHYIKPRS